MIINDKDLDVMYIRFFSFIFASIILISFIVYFLTILLAFDNKNSLLWYLIILP